MEGGRGRHRRALAGAVVLAAVAVLGGCGRHAGTPYRPPGRGQAAILLTADEAGSGLDLNTIRADDGMAFAPDGSLYLLRTDLFRISPDRKVSRVWRAGAYVTGGLAVLPDGALAVGVRGGVLRVDRHGKASTLAGVPDPAPGKATGTVAAAGSGPFVGVARPLGSRPDGTLLVQDSMAVWAVRNGVVTKVLDSPANSATLDADSDEVPVRSTADAAGDVYFMSVARPLDGLADRITRVTPEGKAAHVPVPQRIAGLAGGPGRLHVESLAGDGADGVYVDALDDDTSTSGLDDYVLHLSGGRAEVVAHSHTTEHVLDCTLTHPVGARELPCALPQGMAYHRGALALDGMVHYTLEVAVS
ncbi:hypothetical protein SAMN05216223_11155 [Actinacidiphila yanglinensis]|uniref:Uncharacterized protein n=1 Tax=Actinacidiphila yanglinensis TaxID=310779 RepID=A0A1H6D1S9_9ACTN|nr:hypothetical protein [Actinacidiphila yanglinensis]SEG78755.1 hypothetical protein SAMN05216223_11155 [Actinacidiphila yanglinensis]